MRSDAVKALMDIADPLCTDAERWAAYRWFEREVFEWRLDHGLVSDEEFFEHNLRESMTEPIEQKNGCGEVCVTYMRAPKIPTRMLRY